MSTDTVTGHVIKLFVRADPEVGTEDSKTTAIESLRDLERAGVIDRFERVAWGKLFRPSGPLSGSDYHEQVRRHLSDFEEWADRAGVSLDHAFPRREFGCTLTDESFAVVALPSLAAAEYEDGTLVGVYPHQRDGTVYTVSEFLADLGASAPDAVASPAE